jgi:peptidoglycan biosynthesis protein MviN/MurJ (putative lipid II flippase)
LGTGAFGWSETRITAAVFALFLLSLAAQGVTLLFVRGYYAAERTLLPLLVTFSTAVLSIALSFLFVNIYNEGGFMHHFMHALLRLADTDNAAVAMLALGYACASIIGATALVVAFSSTVSSVRFYILRALREGFVGAVMAGFACYLTLQGLSHYVETDTFIHIAFQSAIAGIAGISFGSLILFLIGNREVREVWHALHSKVLWRTKPTGSDELPL